MSCKHTESGRSKSASDGTITRANEIRSTVLSALDTKHSKLKDKVWFDSVGSFSSDWLIQSPEGYWGKKSSTLPINLGCEATESGCDKNFLRMQCSSDADCESRNTTCQPLEASVSIPGQSAQKMCLGSGDRLLDRFYKVMVSAETNLDITTLGMAAGRYRPMLVNALSVLAHKANPPRVRILMSGAVSRALNFRQPSQELLDGILAEVRKRDPKNTKELKINLGYLANGHLSWNHAKIIVADQSRMITGGHNFYDPDYNSDNPIFDLSLQVSGPIANQTQNYINELWGFVGKKQGVSKVFSYLFEKEETYWGKNPASKDPSDRMRNPAASSIVRDSDSTTTAPVIGLGRLGAFNKEGASVEESNPSDTGIRALIASSERTLDLAVQDLYFRVFFSSGQDYLDATLKSHILPSPKAPWILDELIKAIFRGVKLRVVQSDQDEGVEGYTMTNYKVAYGLFKEAIVSAAKSDRRFARFSPADLNQYICEHLEYAPWRFTQGESSWTDKTNAKGKIGSHPKLIIVDDSAFYIGSHNFYDADLQEYGVIVASPTQTKSLQNDYWDKIWAASADQKVQDCR